MTERKSDSKPQGEAKQDEKPDAPSGSTTIPGGRYRVNGKLVDANGKPVKG